MDKVAVVILNWNGAEMMQNFLPSVLACSQETGVSVYVADNGSEDDSVDMLKSDFPQVNLICLDRNYGFAEGYNKALEKVNAEYYVLLNSDVEIRDRHWLSHLILYMDTHPEAGACQPKLMSLSNPDTFEYAGGAGGFLDRYGYPYCRGRIMDTVEKDEGQYDDIVPLMWATGAALMVRAADWRKAGGLDGRFFAHMEEIDFCWRLRIMGRQIVCVSQSRVYHLGGATLSKGNPRKVYLNFRNNLLMLYKNLPEAELKEVMRMKRVLDAVAALKFLLTGDIGAFRAVRTARRDFNRMKHDGDIVSLRREIQAGRVGDSAGERTGISILWQYYVHRCRRYQDLKHYES